MYAITAQQAGRVSQRSQPAGALVLMVGLLTLVSQGRADAQAGWRLSDLEAAARQNPTQADAQIAYGRGLIRAGQLDRALKQMERGAQLAKRSPESLFELARVRFAEDNYRKSRAACAALRKEHRGHVLHEICMARAFLVWRRASRAEPHLEAALRESPNHIEALFAQAEYQRFRNEHEQSEATYRRVLQLDANFAEAHVGLAKLQLLLGRKRDATETLREAVAKHPEHPQVLLLLSELTPANEAVGFAQRALAVRPGWLEAEQALGAAYLAAGQHQKAELQLRAVLKRDKKNGQAHGKLGETLLAQGRLAQAENALVEALKLQPNFPDTALALARLYGKTGRHEEAFDYFRQAAGMRSTDSLPLIEAAELAKANGRTVLAAAFVERALERHPHEANALALRGDLLAARGDKAAAIASYQEALNAKSQDTQRAIDRAAVEAKLRALR